MEMTLYPNGALVPTPAGDVAEYTMYSYDTPHGQKIVIKHHPVCEKAPLYYTFEVNQDVQNLFSFLMSIIEKLARVLEIARTLMILAA